MKILLLSLVMLIASSCNSEEIKEDAFIIGKWSLVNVNGLSGYVNPDMEFVKNGVGKIIKPSGEEVVLTYILFSGNNEIKLIFRGNRSYFTESEYTYAIRVVDDIEILTLTSKEGNEKYTLKRGKRF